MKFLRSLLPSSRKFDAPIQPDKPFYAVGDVHGVLSLVEQIPTIAAGTTGDTPTVVYVGDYVDRGPDSAGVLRWLFDQQTNDPDHVICLMGNHERMMLDTLRNPEKHGYRWLQHGGMETVASFQVRPIVGQGYSEDWIAMRDELRAAMGEDLYSWMRELPLSWQSGNVFVCHAGADPAQPVDDQKPYTLLWGAEEFHTKTRQDGIWVLHGHTIVGDAAAQNGRIAIDTGAYATGRLTCAHVTQDGVEFKTAQE